jgi:hypothetical protein
VVCFDLFSFGDVDLACLVGPAIGSDIATIALGLVNYAFDVV